MQGPVDAFVSSYLRDTASCSDIDWARLCSEQQEGLAQLRALAAGQAQASVQASLVVGVQQHQAQEYDSEGACCTWTALAAALPHAVGSAVATCLALHVWAPIACMWHHDASNTALMLQLDV